MRSEAPCAAGQAGNAWSRRRRRGSAAAMNEAVVRRTQESLGRVIRKPPLTDRLLSKPPFRYLHDVITEVGREPACGPAPLLLGNRASLRAPLPSGGRGCGCRGVGERGVARAGGLPGESPGVLSAPSPGRRDSVTFPGPRGLRRAGWRTQVTAAGVTLRAASRSQRV